MKTISQQWEEIRNAMEQSAEVYDGNKKEKKKKGMKERKEGNS